MQQSQILQKLINRKNLSSAEMHWQMSEIMNGRASSAQVAAVLTALRMKGESIDEMTAAAQVMREMAEPMHLQGNHLIDTCGTGGDGQNTFNISTASAFVVAAAGGKVAKHGNRSVSSSCGSADVLEATGVNLDLNPEQVKTCVDQIGVGFLFAPRWHGAMKHARTPRKELGVRTLFNLLGPLSNPAQIPNQLIGVFDNDWLEPFAEVLQRLGSQHVLVVHADDGLDEISIASSTQIAELNNGKISRYSIEPEQFGMQRTSLKALAVNNAQQSLELINQVFDAKPGPALDIVLLNAGAAIYAANLTTSFEDGIQLARNVINNGSAKARFGQLIELSRQLSRHGMTNDSSSSYPVSAVSTNTPDTPDVLKKILARKQEEIASRQLKRSIEDLKQITEDEAGKPRGFVQALEYHLSQNRPAIIAEVKKASPSKGIIRENFNPSKIAAQYAHSGATCLSVLTDKDFFQGSEANLMMAKKACPLPVLRKDFIVDPYQIYESRAIDSDCILLIVSALSDSQLQELYGLATELGMDVLVEVHNETELHRALKLDAKLIGINNRNLHTFKTSLNTSEQLVTQIPDNRIIVTESGIHTPGDVARMQTINVNTFLVGESLMSADDPGKQLQLLFSLD
ncbi:MAG: anthranilate phosphoribosyltransferase [Gammaproteobacteria bacterium]|nr:anthranilate phosphoribosyltransferase [Gammaproteobacteria bacterium]